MTDTELKAAFAAFLLETPNEPLSAALKLYPAEKDRGAACRIAFAWPNDPDVIAEQLRLRADGYTGKKLPTKEEIIDEMWELARSKEVSPRDRANAARLIAEMQSFIKQDQDTDSKRMPTAPVYKLVSE